MEKYVVYQVYRNSGRRKILLKGLTREEAKRVVNATPDRENSMVVFDRQ